MLKSSALPVLLSCLLHSGGILFLGRHHALAFSPLSFFRDRSSGRRQNNYLSINHRAWCTSSRIKGNGKELYSSANNVDSNDNNCCYHDASVSGVSVSPSGFLVLLQSTINSKKDVAFPIQLTSPPESLTNSNSISNSGDDSSTISSSNLTLPSLFQENDDQTSVTSPEALTFLQLLNGVDMATPILGPDTLSLICVWYAFLLEEWELTGGADFAGGSESGETQSILVEDELGLASSTSTEEKDVGNWNNDKFKAALDYIRAMVRTTLPPSSDGSYYLSYMDASPWQRTRIQLPRAWLHGVRLQELDLLESSDDSKNASGNDDCNTIGKVPIQFVLECSVDDGTKMLEIPLLAIPSSLKQAYESTMTPTMQLQMDISNEILQESSHNYNVESSAAFMSLALFHRYNKSGAGSADSPVLKVSDGLLGQLEQLQHKENQGKDGMRYCWTVPGVKLDDDIDTVIRKEGLPLYRTLSQIQEEDQRVLQHLEEQNFGKNPASSSGGGSSGSSADGSADTSNNNTISQTQQPQQQRKKSLTLEQQATKQKLKSAWKIAMQREDSGALEKIQKAMEDLEKEVMQNPDDDEQVVEEQEEESALQKIQRAMEQSNIDENNRMRSQQQKVLEEKDGEEEDVVGLISELEEATTSRMDELDADNEDEK